MQGTTPSSATAFDTWQAYQRLFEHHLVATNRAPLTARTYGIAVDQLGQFLAAKGMPADPAAITREHLIEWFLHLRRRKEEGGQGVGDASALQRYRSIQAFFKFLVETDEIRESPLAKIPPPAVPEKLVPIISDDELRRLFKACSGKDFEAKRDKAIFSLLLDTGMRLAELAGIELEHVDFDSRTITIMGKGRRRRLVPFVQETEADLTKYLLARQKHPHRDLPWLWIGRKGRLTATGVAQMVGRRGTEARIPDLHPHLFRHTAAHRYLANGGDPGNLMRVAGWRSRQMLDRYGASAAGERARDAHAQLSPRKGL